MNDLISRQAAIDAVCMEWCNVKHQNCEHPFDVEKDDYYWCEGCTTALQTLPSLPSVQPEVDCQKCVFCGFTGFKQFQTAQPDVPDTNVGDTISRQAAISYAISGRIRTLPTSEDGENWIRTSEVRQSLLTMPSAQSELIEQGAYVRGFEQGRTQGMIDNTIKAEWTNADALDLQQTCNQLATDCISRQAAITIPILPKEHRKYQTMNLDDAYELGWFDCQDCIEKLPSAQSEIKGLITEDGRIKILTAQHWIPCSERLPDRVGLYWTTAVGGSGTRTMTIRFFDGTKWERKRRDYTKVIAWMPLPEAYKEDE